MASPCTVLLVDDDADVREITTQMLGSRGFDVLVAQSGYEAMRLLAKIRPDVLLADIVMPDFNGIELAKQAKLLQPDLKVLFMTGYLSLSETSSGWHVTAKWGMLPSHVGPMWTDLVGPRRAAPIESVA